MGSCLSSDGGGGGGGGCREAASPTTPSTPNAGGKKLRKGSSRKRLGTEQLHRIPGRMFLNGTCGMASLFTQQGKKGTNQDAMIVWENFTSRADTVFCGVFDGHGPHGHIVARRVRDQLPLKLSAHWEDFRESNIRTVGGMNSDGTASEFVEEESASSVDPEEKESVPEIFTALKESFHKAFKVMDKELKFHPSINCFCSGTTAVTLVKQGQYLVVGNVGDSRAILGTRDHNDQLIAVQLTVDLKPNLPREEERIKKCKGRVFALKDEPEVARVWLPNTDSPGLAMARAFGDFCLKDFGLISVPDISYHCLTEKDQFVVLATDGIWDVLSNKEVVDIVASAPTRSTASRLLVESAIKAWRFKYPTSKIDDCAVVCLFLDPDASVNSFSYKTTGSASSENAEVGNSMQKPVNVRSSEIVTEDDQDTPKSDENGTAGDEWSALEGVSRSNTLLTLPRFTAGDEQAAESKIQK
ncbi:putative protein-serine/threonine phosphatase [Dioscorea sansibarensis]